MNLLNKFIKTETRGNDTVYLPWGEIYMRSDRHGSFDVNIYRLIFRKHGTLLTQIAYGLAISLAEISFTKKFQNGTIYLNIARKLPDVSKQVIDFILKDYKNHKETIIRVNGNNVAVFKEHISSRCCARQICLIG